MKNCPFCNGIPHVASSPEGIKIVCNSCGSSTDAWPCHSDAKIAWAHRHGDPCPLPPPTPTVSDLDLTYLQDPEVLKIWVIFLEGVAKASNDGAREHMQAIVDRYECELHQRGLLGVNPVDLDDGQA